ncbi:uncharacterized protein LOC110266744 [Arachis ipaensis]|uniref:uncharacterized protein LOC110266744 n=1 Tax=Arachis ipaensis TaxID=130454 RepID=UPI000A2AFF8B|nr:uncharacterized protein LOC110266744 [Arachis ipaensis]
MRKKGLKMNPLKCVFGVSAGNFLGFVIHKKGIVIDKSKANAILALSAPKSKKEVQSFLGKVNYLRRFISNLFDRTRVFAPLVKLKNDSQIKWINEHQQAFDSIKVYLSKALIMANVHPHEPLKLYIAASANTIGCMLAQDDENGHERCYMVAKTVKVVAQTDLIKYILSFPMLQGRLEKWMLVLTGFDLQYIPAKAVKGQVIADFLVDNSNNLNDQQANVLDIKVDYWKLYFDRLKHKDGVRFLWLLFFFFKETNLVSRIVRLALSIDKVHVQSSYYASKLHVKIYIKEVGDSKIRLVSTCQITLQYISHLSSQPSYSVSDEINGELVRLKSIEELLNCANEGSYWILASTVRLDVGKDDWFYKGCTRCLQKLEGAEPSYCKKCDQADSNPLLRFRFQVIVSDGLTGRITLVLWDRETMQVVGKTATEIKENFFDDGEDADTYPKALDSVIDTKLLIKVAVSSRNINGYDDVYNVMRISDDEQLIAKLGHDAAVSEFFRGQNACVNQFIHCHDFQGVDNNVSCQ